MLSYALPAAIATQDCRMLAAPPQYDGRLVPGLANHREALPEGILWMQEDGLSRFLYRFGRGAKH